MAAYNLVRMRKLAPVRHAGNEYHDSVENFSSLVGRLLPVQIQADGKSRLQLQRQVPKKTLKTVINALQKAAT